MRDSAPSHGVPKPPTCSWSQSAGLLHGPPPMRLARTAAPSAPKLRSREPSAAARPPTAALSSAISPDRGPPPPAAEGAEGTVVTTGPLGGTSGGCGGPGQRDTKAVP